MRADTGVNPGRRAVLRAIVSLPAAAILAPGRLVAADAVVNAHGGPIVPPVAVPDARVRLADGSRARLQTLLEDKTSALQLIFTHCTTTCPMQGAIFQAVQRNFPDQLQRGAQLISLSVDPTQDSPQNLRDWLARFQARAGWIAAVPHPADLARLRSFFGTPGDSLISHATQVQIIDRRGLLVWRTNELPSAQSVMQLLQKA